MGAFSLALYFLRFITLARTAYSLLACFLLSHSLHSLTSACHSGLDTNSRNYRALEEEISLFFWFLELGWYIPHSILLHLLRSGFIWSTYINLKICPTHSSLSLPRSEGILPVFTVQEYKSAFENSDRNSQRYGTFLHVRLGNHSQLHSALYSS